MDFPKLQAGQYAVLHAEVETGIVLRLDGQRYLAFGEVWRVFESIGGARDYAAAEVRSASDCRVAPSHARQNRVERVQA